MGQLLLLLVVALTVAAVVFGVTVLVTGRDPGLVPAEPDGRAVPLPGGRPLAESDLGAVRFDTALRGYRMDQVDQAMRRAAYDIGYKSELVGVLEAEVDALREGRTADAEAMREARLAAGAAAPTAAAGVSVVDGPEPLRPADVAADGPSTDRAADGPSTDRAADGRQAVAGSGDPADEASRPLGQADAVARSESA